MTKAEQDTALERITAMFKLTDLWAVNWDPPLKCNPGIFPVLSDGVIVCGDCRQAHIKVGHSGLHPGDPRLPILRDMGVIDGPVESDED